MEQYNMNRFENGRAPRMYSGIILVATGVLLLAYKMGAPIPHWLFTWPVLLILIGFLTGIKNRFNNPAAMIMIIVGGVFLVDKIMPGLNFHNYILPAILIGIGLIYIMRPRQSFSCKKSRHRINADSGTAVTQDYQQIENTAGTLDPAEYVEINNAFGGIKRNIISKNFKGGSLNNFMSGTELNLLQADMQRPTVLEVNNVFGGLKLIVPSNWDIKNEMSVIFGGVEDKRSVITGHTPDKTMVLKGTCIFGGVEVSNY